MRCGRAWMGLRWAMVTWFEARLHWTLLLEARLVVWASARLCEGVGGKRENACGCEGVE